MSIRQEQSKTIKRFNIKKMKPINYEVIFVGSNVNQWLVKDYIISEQRGDWFCSCALKYKRNPKTSCKHIDIVKHFLLDPKEREKVEERTEKRRIRIKLNELMKKTCKHLFILTKCKGKIEYTCKNCQVSLEIKEFKEYRRISNQNLKGVIIKK